MGKEVKEQKGETGRKAVSHAFMRKDGGMNLRERERERATQYIWK